MWRLGERFVPVYLHHRFQVGAVVKTVGGMDFRYGVRGDPLPVTEVIDGARQRRAMNQLSDALSAESLDVPEDVLRMLAPRPFGFAEIRKDFESRAGPAFDHLGIARTLSRMVLGGVFDEPRMARVAAFYDRDPSLPSPEDVVDHFIDALWSAEGGALSRVPQRELVDVLIDLAASTTATVESRAAAEWGLRRIADRAAADAELAGDNDAETAAHGQLVAADIERFLARRFEGGERTDALAAPSGTPIGSRR